MDNDELVKYMELSDVPETYQPIVRLIGLDAFLKLCSYGSGSEIYFPMQETIYKKVRNKLILREYNGYNHIQLSKKYNLTAKHIMNIVKGSNSA